MNLHWPFIRNIFLIREILMAVIYLIMMIIYLILHVNDVIKTKKSVDGQMVGHAFA